MKRTAVESSNLASVGYDEISATLEIEVQSGGVYQYLDVPKNIYEALMTADSHGRYFIYHIKNDYEYRKNR